MIVDNFTKEISNGHTFELNFEGYLKFERFQFEPNNIASFSTSLRRGNCFNFYYLLTGNKFTSEDYKVYIQSKNYINTTKGNTIWFFKKEQM